MTSFTQPEPLQAPTIPSGAAVTNASLHRLREKIVEGAIAFPSALITAMTVRN